MSQLFKTRKGYPPGVWEDKDGGLHFSLPEIMEHLGIAYNSENEERVRNIFDELLKRELPEADIIHQENCIFCGSHGPNHKPDCKNR